MSTRSEKYDNVMVALHWIIGIGILLLGGIELIRHEFPKGHVIRESLKFVHQPAGTVLLGLVFIRLAWRMLYAKAVPGHGATSIGTTAAKIVHISLYALMIGLPLLGLVYVFGSNKSVDFGIVTWTLPLQNVLGGVAKSARWWHETLGIAILAIALLHAAAALGHQYVLRDGIMSRMRFSRLGKTATDEEHAEVAMSGTRG